jgi:hypothetical protein
MSVYPDHGCQPISGWRYDGNQTAITKSAIKMIAPKMRIPLKNSRMNAMNPISRIRP